MKQTIKDYKEKRKEHVERMNNKRLPKQAVGSRAIGRRSVV